MSKRRGVKVYGGQPVNAGGIIIRQLGTKVGATTAGHLLPRPGSAAGGGQQMMPHRRAGEQAGPLSGVQCNRPLHSGTSITLPGRTWWAA